MTNLFGRGKEPFWHQASTNLVKFVILLHQTLDDYVTLFQVYEHIINPDKLRARIANGEVRFRCGNRRLVVDKEANGLHGGVVAMGGTTTTRRGWRGRRETRTSRRPSRGSESRFKH